MDVGAGLQAREKKARLHVYSIGTSIPTHDLGNIRNLLLQSGNARASHFHCDRSVASLRARSVKERRREYQLLRVHWARTSKKAFDNEDTHHNEISQTPLSECGSLEAGPRKTECYETRLRAGKLAPTFRVREFFRLHSAPAESRLKSRERSNGSVLGFGPELGGSSAKENGCLDLNSLVIELGDICTYA